MEHKSKIVELGVIEQLSWYSKSLEIDRVSSVVACPARKSMIEPSGLDEKLVSNGSEAQPKDFRKEEYESSIFRGLNNAQNNSQNKDSNNTQGNGPNNDPKNARNKF